MTSLGGGRSHHRRPECRFRALTLLLILLTPSALDGICPGDLARESSTMCRNSLFAVAFYTTPLQVFLTAAFRFVSVQDRRTFNPPSTPIKASSTLSVTTTRVRFTMFTISVTISSSFQGWTIKPYLRCFNRVRYGQNFSTIQICYFDSFYGIGLMNFNGNNGGVPESVSLLAPNPGLQNQRTVLILNRLCVCFPVFFAGVLYRSVFGPDSAIEQLVLLDSAAVVAIPAPVLLSARASSSSPRTSHTNICINGATKISGGTRNPSGSFGLFKPCYRIIFTSLVGLEASPTPTIWIFHCWVSNSVFKVWAFEPFIICWISLLQKCCNFMFLFLC